MLCFLEEEALVRYLTFRHCIGDPSGCGDVIVFDHDHVIETHSVVAAPTDENCPLV